MISLENCFYYQGNICNNNSKPVFSHPLLKWVLNNNFLNLKQVSIFASIDTFVTLRTGTKQTNNAPTGTTSAPNAAANQANAEAWAQYW